VHILDESNALSHNLDNTNQGGAVSQTIPSSTTATQISDEAEFSQSGKFKTTPAVRRIARENKLNLQNVIATGPKGRILKEDVLAYLKAPKNNQPTTSIAHNVAPAKAPIEKKETKSESVNVQDGDFKSVPIRGVQRLMVKSMTAAREVQHLTLGEEVNVDKLIALRKEINEDIKRRRGSHAVRFSYMPFIIKV
jgi:2-oxoisovalerate dehydrogenase E2 component (dihydrolipoyl transacylase)